MIFPKEIVEEILLNTDTKTFIRYILDDYDKIKDISRTIFYLTKYFNKNNYDVYEFYNILIEIKSPLIQIDKVTNVSECVFFICEKKIDFKLPNILPNCIY